MAKTLTFETKCYEKDWAFIIKGRHLHEAIANCNYRFDRKILYLNNFKDYGPIRREADKLVAASVIDEYYVVSDYAEEALKALNIDKESFKGGYYYSIAELVSIYLCKTDYLLHFSGDAKMEKNGPSWIPEAISLLEAQPEVMVANPTWDHKFHEAKQEAFKEDDNWYYSYGFSDQCYLVRSGEFKQGIYNEQHPDSERYPEYGGELFEKRVDAYLRNHQRLRATSKRASYEHKNFPKNRLAVWARGQF